MYYDARYHHSIEISMAVASIRVRDGRRTSLWAKEFWGNGFLVEED
jgi:hypothetical protein